MEVVPGIHVVELVHPVPFKRHMTQYILVGERVALVDTGLPDIPKPHTFPYLSSLGRSPGDINAVLITHGDVDHFGGNAIVRQAAPQALIMAHTLDVRLVENPARVVAERYEVFAAEHGIGRPPEVQEAQRAMGGAPTPVDVWLQGGEQLRLGDNWHVEIVYTPGHTAGHISVYDPRSGSAFIGDAVLWHGLYNEDVGRFTIPPPYYDADAYLSTIDRLAALNLEHLFPSHYEVLHGERVPQFLMESRAWAERLDAALRATLREKAKPLTLRELCFLADERVGPYDEPLEFAPPVHAHLLRFEREGSVQREGKDGFVTWQISL